MGLIPTRPARCRGRGPSRAASIRRAIAASSGRCAQFAGFGSARRPTSAVQSAARAGGSIGLSVAFDLPTLMGYDADHPRSEGEVGKTGVSISSLADMEKLFDGHSARSRSPPR
ncbi:MAG: methylmalonyl-CoA mutase family protein [Gemmatimonadaceae bacterium]|nr:methylmalonyl-CoA mutase family protein [Gemmatimonadaceae bacterium]